MKTFRNIFRAIGSVLPHLEIILCLMFTTFFIVDCFNNAMMFITHPMSKALTLVIGVLALLLMITLLLARRYARLRRFVSGEMPVQLCFAFLLLIAFVITLLFYVTDVRDPDRLLYTQRTVKNVLMSTAFVSLVSSIVTIRLQRMIFARKHHIHRHKRHHKEHRHV